MLMRQSEKFKAEIIDLDYRGRGIAKTDGAVVFLDDGLPGDVAEISITKAKKRFIEGHVERIITHSPKRVEAQCRYADLCGGCPLMSLDYTAQLDWKRMNIKSVISRVGETDADVLYPIAMLDPIACRNHMQFHVHNGKPCLYARDSKKLICIDNCTVQRNAANDVLEKLIIKSVPDTLSGIGIRTNSQGKRMVIYVGTKKLTLPLAEDLAVLSDFIGEGSFYYNENPDSREHYGLRFTHLQGEKTLTGKFMSFDYQISPSSFFQVNLAQAEKLVNSVLEMAGHCNLIYDLYCGVGTLTLPLSRTTDKIVGIEWNVGAVGDAVRNAKLNGITNAKFVAGRVENRLLEELKYASCDPDLIVLDPPRAGASKEVIRSMIDIKPKKIIYVSCNPATMARDIKILKNHYHIDHIQPVDMFPNTSSIECVTLMSRTK